MDECPKNKLFQKGNTTMKKLLAVLLAAVLVASMCFVFVSAEGEELAPDYSTKPLWVTHYGDITAEGAGTIMTEAYDQCVWYDHYAFAPIEGATNAYELVETSYGVGAGTGTPLAIPEGGFVYLLNSGNDYPSLGAGYEGLPNYTNAGVNAAIEMARTWTVGDKFAFEGIDFEGSTVPTTTPDINWYDEGYVCTATVTPYVRYDETETIDEETGDHAFAVAYGYLFEVNYVDGTIGGEDATIVTSSDAYSACNPNWAITVHLAPAGDLYEVVQVIATPGAGATLDLGEGELALVVHSASSQPEENGIAYANWASKVAALALKAGDKIYIDAEMTSAYVLMPGEVITNDGEGDGDGEGESLEDILAGIVGEPNPDAAFDVVLEGPESYQAGDKITITATVKNIAKGIGVHMVEFEMAFDFEQLVLLNETDDEGALVCVTNTPDGDWENFTTYDEETGVITVSVFTASNNMDHAAVADGDLVFTFEFQAAEDASEDTGAVINPQTIYGLMNTDTAEEELAANADYIVVAYGEGGSDDEKPAPGDATNMIVFAVLALVAIAGSAVVIKSRR